MDNLLRQVLSAEPLVGLKPQRLPAPPSGARLSAEPLVGLKQRSCQPRDIGESLSAEPLVGLKLIDRIAD